MISIITPTYNRKGLLSRLYDALKRQTVSDFEWIIIDDGSSDNTEELVKQWIMERIIRIRYFYKENGGKHSAHNIGISEAEGEISMCIDSDDYPTDNCIEVISKYWNNKCKNNPNISGIIAQKGFCDDKCIGDDFPDNIKMCTLFYLTEILKVKGDKCLIYRTDILKKNKFPEINGVKFITESVIYDKIDRNYSMFLLNEIVCICEYQNDGYTNNFKKLMFNNPIGFKLYYNQRIDMAQDMKSRIIYMGKYHAFKLLSKNRSYDYCGEYKNLLFFSIPIGILFYIYYKLKMRGI